MDKFWIKLIELGMMVIVGGTAFNIDNPGMINLFKCYVVIAVFMNLFGAFAVAFASVAALPEDLKPIKITFWMKLIRVYYVIILSIIIYHGLVVWAGSALISLAISMLSFMMFGDAINKAVEKRDKKQETTHLKCTKCEHINPKGALPCEKCGWPYLEVCLDKVIP